MNYLAKEDIDALLGNWVKLNKDLLELPLPAVQQLLETEVRSRRRPQMVTRLYGRFNKLRAEKERQQLAKGELPWGSQSASILKLQR